MLRQYEASGQKIYPILSEKSENAVAAAMRFIGQQQQQVDVVLFDLPGTINSLGVFKTLSAMDYVFVPMKADKIVMESTITFARTINESMVTNRDLNTKEIYLFWTMIDKRERTPLYDQYDKVLAAFSLKRLSTHIPLRSKFNKEIMGAGAVYRSTIFAPDNAFTKECHLEVLASEICTILNQ